MFRTYRTTPRRPVIIHYRNGHLGCYPLSPRIVVVDVGPWLEKQGLLVAQAYGSISQPANSPKRKNSIASGPSTSGSSGR